MTKKQRGVTLIELMISMMLGLGLIAGIGQLFVQSQKSFRLQQNLSDMTDDASFILESFTKGVLLAGFADNPSESNLFREKPSVIATSGVPTISFGANETIHGIDTGTGINLNSQLAYRYQLGSSPYAVNTSSELDNFIGTSELTGIKNAIPEIRGDIVTVRIYKKNDSDGIPVLYSKAETDSDTGNNAEPLISDVQQLVFKYGIKKLDLTCANPTTPTIPDYCFYYTDATTVTAGNLWKNVFSVKVFLVMRSAEDNLVRVQKGYKFDGVQQTPMPTDKRLYKTFSKTIFFRITDK
jgi:prepilin-type N-terminal cleavage/methylation domain-containing protein